MGAILPIFMLMGALTSLEDVSIGEAYLLTAFFLDPNDLPLLILLRTVFPG